MSMLGYYGRDFSEGFIRRGPSHGVLALDCAEFDEYCEEFGFLDGVVEDAAIIICIRSGVPGWENS
jgi:hypothetical protein